MGGQIEHAFSTAILLEYEEVAAAMHGPVFAREVMNFLDLATASGFVRHFTPQFHFRIITADPDDDIFADLHHRRRRGIHHHRRSSLQGTAKRGLQAAADHAGGVHPAIPVAIVKISSKIPICV